MWIHGWLVVLFGNTSLEALGLQSPIQFNGTRSVLLMQWVAILHDEAFQGVVFGSDNWESRSRLSPCVFSLSVILLILRSSRAYLANSSIMLIEACSFFMSWISALISLSCSASFCTIFESLKVAQQIETCQQRQQCSCCGANGSERFGGAEIQGVPPKRRNI